MIDIRMSISWKTKCVQQLCVILDSDPLKMKARIESNEGLRAKYSTSPWAVVKLGPVYSLTNHDRYVL